MFAFAIWDARKRELFLARDRLGIKPLYYAELPGGFLFGSEIKALLEHPAIQADLDEEAFFHYLTFVCTPGPADHVQGDQEAGARRADDRPRRRLDAARDLVDADVGGRRRARSRA